MDGAVGKWLEILRSDERDEDGIPLYSLADKERVFKAITNWLKDRKRLFPDLAPREGAQVSDMRNLLKDPAIVRDLKKMFGTGAPPARTTLTTPASKDAEQKRSAAGSALTALVFEGEGLEDEQ